LATEATAHRSPADEPPRSRLGGFKAATRRLLLVLPTGAWTLLFFLVPLGIMVVYSFGQRDVLTLKLYWGWTIQNYVEIADSLYLSSITRSLILSGTATVLCLVIGFPVAY
jgi:ABC-type spermidine/putrescine transport system permease subunit I